MRTAASFRFLTLAVLAGLFLGGLHLLAQQGAQQEPKKGDPAPKPVKLDVKFSGPFTHENLTIFLVHGEDKMKGKIFLTLPEALEQKKVIIYETKEVNTLQVENVSATEEVLMLSGDIISGGQQDRVITLDQVLPPKSGKLPLQVHCVEKTADRWMTAWKEKDKVFHGSNAVLNSKELRLSNAYYMDQGKVWKEVGVSQAVLAKNLAVNVQDQKSTSSLNLTLEVKEVKAAAEKFTSKLEKIVKDKKDVIGYAFAINGKVYGLDVYGSNALFQKVWPRLVRANAIEALMETDSSQSFKAVTQATVQKFLDDAATGKVSAKEVGKDVQRIQSDAKTNVHIQTVNPKMGMAIRDLILTK